YEFAKENLKKAAYKDIILVNGDGKEGYPPYAPYDKICVTAAASSVPEALINQLKDGGKLIIPLGMPESTQKLVLLEKSKNKIKQKFITYVAYVPMI
ncbi:MAG: protein-L-isoaspartate O-methyltransferase, partial [Candidatus Aenigmarchaeota archaeon]|nr:protein-L-isoaspartate O-methyltransferase [Candidatus Aenigmarchaeota archaeon]